MEFGMFQAMYTPNHHRTDRLAEHRSVFKEVDLVKVADRMGFKYAWSSEHHFLDEYSHLSASESYMAYALAVTERIHIGSGIINITPPVNHPARVAERVAMLDHLGEGRFEFGTGRGSSSTEVHGFGIDAMTTTREMFDEVLPEIPKMWKEERYSFDGRFFSMPERTVLPKPYTDPHPPIWVAAGNPDTFERAARLGIGVLCFVMGPPDMLAPLIEVYKKTIDKAEPVGDYVNDNVMVTSQMCCLEDGGRARELFLGRMGSNYHTSNVFRYLDSFPRPPVIPQWPELIPPTTAEQLEMGIATQRICVGDPEEVAGSVQRYVDIGADQLSFGTMQSDLEIEEATELYETFGRHVLPRFDHDPVHRTQRQREEQVGAGAAV